MAEWLKSNYGTMIIIAVLILVVALIIRSIFKDRKKGKHICGGNCGSCGACSLGSGEPDPDFQAKLFRITIKIDGMYCSMCESHVNDTFRQKLNVKKITSDAKKGETVMISEVPYSIEKLRETLDPTGYKVISSEIRALV